MTEGQVVWARRRAWGGRLAMVAAAAAAFASITAASASAAPKVSALAQGHAYRQGVVPMRVPGTSRRPAAAASGGNLTYGGGVQGVGVTTGAPRVYLIFWGSQWGTASTNGAGYTVFSGDTKGVAPDLQAFFSGLGTNNDTWSGVMTQYCEGIAAGLKTCPNTAPHVGYPTGGALAGVWEDTASAAPGRASQTQLGNEAGRGAAHFGNSTTAMSRNVQYFVVSPTGTHPDGFNTVGSNFCAWHFYAGPTRNTLAYTNMPYIPDAGASCGKNFVNSGTAGLLDGVTIVGGHEYAETITDQFPAGGWTDSVGNENGDKCAWITSGQGASQNVVLSTGSFAVQSTWANDFNSGAGGCEVSHPIFGQTNTVTVTSPGGQTTAAGTSVSLQIQAGDSGGATLTYGATGLPAGLAINSSTGLITGTPTTPGNYSVTVTASDTTGASGSASFSWSITGCSAQQLLGNPGFETGSAAPWSATPNTLVQAATAGEPSHSGSFDANLGGFTVRTADMLSQTVTVPAGCANYTFAYWLHIDSTENPSTNGDTLKVLVLSNNQTVTTTVGAFTNQNAAAGYQQYTVDVSAYAGQTITLRFRGVLGLNGAGTTNFVLDDTALNVS